MEVVVFHISVALKRENKDQQAGRRIKIAKYLMSTLIFLSWAFYEWRKFVSPFAAGAVETTCDTETERGQEKVKMKEVCEWSPGSHPHRSNVCQSFASARKKKSESRPPR